MHKATISQLATRFRGVAFADKYTSFELSDTHALQGTAAELMQHIPPFAGACAMLSATWAAMLDDRHSLPVLVVAGDLKIGRNKVFKCKKNIPTVTNSEDLIRRPWSGHCWIQVGGYIGDLSVFRTAYAVQGGNTLTDFIHSRFGKGRGALISKQDALP